MTTPVRILVTPRSLTEAGLDQVAALQPLRERGFELVSAPAGRSPREEELIALVPGCAGWLAGVERITERVLAAASDLRVISRNGTGTDSVDVAAAERLGIRVERAVGANAQGVAELTLALTLCALRDVVGSADALRSGTWRRRRGTELADTTVGVVGLGEIGRRTTHAFTALGATVLGHDPYPTGSPARLVPLDTLFAESDVVSLHCPPPADGRPLLGAAQVQRMRHGAVLVNTARSALVDGDAVRAALESGRLSCYAVDAFDTEPPRPSALLSHPHVIATPHIGGFTGASVLRATEAAVANLLAALPGRGQ